MIIKNDDQHFVLLEKCECQSVECNNWLMVGNAMRSTDGMYMVVILPDNDGNAPTVWLNEFDIRNLIEDLNNLLEISE